MTDFEELKRRVSALTDSMTPEVRDLLAAISDALDAPFAGTYDAIAKRQELISDRAAFITGSLRAVLNGDAAPAHAVEGIRSYTATPGATGTKRPTEG